MHRACGIHCNLVIYVLFVEIQPQMRRQAFVPAVYFAPLPTWPLSVFMETYA
jgi:hypothetical protein